MDVMIAISSNFFYTVTLPCSLWFMDKGKQSLPDVTLNQHKKKDVILSEVEGSPKSDSIRGKNTVLFIDARNIFRQVTRAVRDFSSEQLNFIANIVRLYRGEAIDNTYLENHKKEDVILSEAEGSPNPYDILQQFPNGYQDIPGLCKVSTISEIKQQGWSLNPGRYVGVAPTEEDSDEDFAKKLQTLQDELEVLNNEAHELEQAIAENVKKILGDYR